jgi:hypothetical protein
MPQGIHPLHSFRRGFLMHVPNLPESQSESQDVSLSHSDPYRPPSEVPGEAKRGKFLKLLKLLAFVGVVAGVLAIVAIANLRKQVAEFGVIRSGKPQLEPPEVVVEQESISAKEE